MGVWIESNSSYGDVIVMVVRGEMRLSGFHDDSQVKRMMRKIGLDRIEGCSLSYNGEYLLFVFYKYKLFLMFMFTSSLIKNN